MFTGIIEEVGQIVSMQDSCDFRTLRVQAGSILDGIKAGASIAVNGVCLTVRTFNSGNFTADLSRETLERTSLNALRPGTTVNLERPMRADGRFGGHIVQGHVDGVGKIRSFDRGGDNWNLQVEFPENAARYVVHKGSIAIDGISQPTKVLAFDMILCTSTEVPERVVYDVVKTLHQNKPALAAAFGAFNLLVPDRMAKPVKDVEFHSGALKYFQEAGIAPKS